MINSDVIKAMNIKELSVYLYHHDFCPEIIRCDEYPWSDNTDCKQCIEKFLQEDCEDVLL